MKQTARSTRPRQWPKLHPALQPERPADQRRQREHRCDAAHGDQERSGAPRLPADPEPQDRSCRSGGIADADPDDRRNAPFAGPVHPGRRAHGCNPRSRPLGDPTGLHGSTGHRYRPDGERDVSAIQLKSRGFALAVSTILEETGVSGSLLAFEITEGIDMEGQRTSSAASPIFRRSASVSGWTTSVPALRACPGCASSRSTRSRSIAPSCRMPGVRPAARCSKTSSGLSAIGA